MEDYLRQYGLLLFLGAAAVVVPTSVLMLSAMAGKLGIRPTRPNPIKLDPFECGMETIGEPRWERFNVRYYRYALLFVLFDVEVVFLFPWAVSFIGLIDSPAYGHVILWEMVIFILTLFLSLAYAWRKGVLEWNPKTESR